MVVEFLIDQWALAVVAGLIIGHSKDRIGTALALALLLGWAGVLIMAFLPSRTQDMAGRCPDCGYRDGKHSVMCPTIRKVT
jgi:MFS family permease